MQYIHTYIGTQRIRFFLLLAFLNFQAAIRCIIFYTFCRIIYICLYGACVMYVFVVYFVIWADDAWSLIIKLPFCTWWASITLAASTMTTQFLWIGNCNAQQFHYFVSILFDWMRVNKYDGNMEWSKYTYVYNLYNVNDLHVCYPYSRPSSRFSAMVLFL